MCPTETRTEGAGHERAVGPVSERSVVRWRQEGRQRNRRFATEAEAIAFEGTVRQDDSATSTAPTTSPGSRRGLRFRSFLQPGKRSGQALVSVVQQAYCAGSRPGGSICW